ncbi:importin subunit alpha-like [Drosophila tropicalis]|uniref:importin subunit alpha-like n=1 Tax=Drosophila tropicalis TaxID=46794 RepID=UPI0035ABE4A2
MEPSDNSNNGQTTRQHFVITVQLRRSRTNSGVYQYFDFEDSDEPESIWPFQFSVDEMLLALGSEDVKIQFVAVIVARKMLSREPNPPIDKMIAHDIVPICLRFLKWVKDPMVQYEAAWALANIASGTSAQTRSVIDSGAVPILIATLKSSSPDPVEMAVWALANIAGDGAVARDVVISEGVVDGILPLITDNTPPAFLRNIVWLIANLCRYKDPPASFDELKRLLPVMSDLLLSSDTKILCDVCWALFYVSDDDDVNKIQAVVDTGAVPRLVTLLDRDETNVIVPALRCVGNIASGTDLQTDVVINSGGLSRLRQLLEHPKSSIVKEAAWTVSNITAGNPTQIHAVMNSGIFYKIYDILERGCVKAQKEAAWAVTNAASTGTQSQIADLVGKYGILIPFLKLLEANDSSIVLIVVTGLHHLFGLAEELNRVEELGILIDNLGGLKKLRALQQHENRDVRIKAHSIIYNFIDRFPIFQPSDNSDEEGEALPH